MSKTVEGQYTFIRCLNCGEIMTGSVTKDGELIPIGLDNDGKCGDADFEVITMQDPAGSGSKSA